MSRLLNVAAHILGMLAVLEREGRLVTSAELAQSIGTHEVVVRRVLSKLKSAGLVESRRGVGGGTVLARDPGRMTLRDAYQAVSGVDARVLERHSDHVNHSCVVGPILAEYLDDVYRDAEEEMLQRLGRVTIEEMSKQVVDRVQRRAALSSPRV
jgi:Rrf2 family protein